METMYNNAFFNNLFSSDEFNFIKHLDSDRVQFDSTLQKEQQNRDLIVKLINGFHDSIYFANMNQKDCEQDKKLLKEAQNIFELLNNNITVLKNNIEISDSISKNLVNLLIKIDSEDNLEESKYIGEINSLKNDISNFITKVENTKTNLSTNNNIICNFINSDEVNKYFKAFSITLPLSTEYEEKSIQNNIEENNDTLLISEKNKKVYLPYSKKEILQYLEQYPDQYSSFEDVIKQEFIYPSDFYLKHPLVARFRETYSLIRDREAKSVIESFKTALDMMFRYDLNPAIIAACKSQNQLENYIECLDKKKTDEFKDFKILFEVAPLKA